jgi:hypothetical protein
MIDEAGLRQYAELIERTLCASAPGFDATAESCTTVQVERGVVYPMVVCGGTGVERAEALLRGALEIDVTRAAVVDRQGHRRPGYRGLLFHAVFRAMAADESGTLQAYAGAWLDLLAAQLESLRWPELPAGQIPADRGALIVDVVWMALAAHDAAVIGGEAPWRRRAAEAFGQLVRGRQFPRTFLTRTGSDNPETHWYHELLLLHAATLYAAQTGDPAITEAVAQNAEFHQNETQPDHATNQPWGLAAFIPDPSTRPLADQMLHAAATIGRGSGVTSILLADALYCLRLWTA